MADGQFSDCALALLRHHLSGYSLMMGASNPESLPGYTEEETRAAYAELVAAELMIAIDTLAQERGARFWLTLAAIERKAEWLDAAPTSRRASP
jgi:hypothetical protein